jgi:hypothetical protein
MKRVGYIYEKIYNIENIKKAIMQSSRGKRDKKYVKEIILNINYFSKRIQDLLLNQTYTPSPYTVKKIFDGASKKERIIYKPRYFPDQIIHWALMLQLHSLILNGMYEYNCGSIPGRGTSYGQKILRKWLDNDYTGTRYCLKMDISKFYPSINGVILKQKFVEKIKDNKCLWLINMIIDSNENGLPIGNYTSQWFSNFFLQGLDHFIKEKLDVKYYIRYVDDFVILGSNKKKLHKTRKAISEYLIPLDLKLKQNWQVSRVDDRGIDFLGLRFFREKTILRKRNALRIKRRVNKIFKKLDERNTLNYIDSCALISYWGWIKRSDSYNFFKKVFKSKSIINFARKMVSIYGKQNNSIR